LMRTEEVDARLLPDYFSTFNTYKDVVLLRLAFSFNVVPRARLGFRMRRRLDHPKVSETLS
jgi:hypothetical protein